MKLYLATFDQLFGLSILLFLTLVIQLIHMAIVFYQFSAKERLMRIALPAAVFFYTLFTALEAAFIQIKTIEAGFAAFPEPLRYAPLIPLVVMSARLIKHQASIMFKLAQFGFMLMFLGRFPFFDEYWEEYYYTFLFIISTVVLVYSALALNKMISYLKRTITAAAPKTIFDSMVYGALIANRKGRVLIINPAMNRILKNLELTEPEYVQDLATQLTARADQNHLRSAPEGWLMRSSDGNAFWLDKKAFNAKRRLYYMVTATDVTSAYLLMHEIEQANLELEEANRRLADMVEGAARTAALAEKVRINQLAHDILGQHLTLATSSIDLAIYKGIMEKKELDRRMEDSAMLLGQSLKDLFTEKEMEFHEMMYSLSETFALIEVKIHFTGDLPPSKHTSLLGHILREAVTNAVRHGRAVNIYVDITHGEDQIKMSIRNDGILPDRKLSFNTGMEGIRRQLFEAGGRLEIEAEEEFVLKTMLPQNR